MFEPVSFSIGAYLGVSYLAKKSGLTDRLRLASRTLPGLPGLAVLDSPPMASLGFLGANPGDLVAGLAARGLDVSLVGSTVGPTVGRIELALGPKERVRRVLSAREDIALLLGTPYPRLFIPSAGILAIEVPRRDRQKVGLASVLSDVPDVLDMAIGLSVDGKPMVRNLKDLVHVLVAGETGGGKSTFLNSLIVSLLIGASPRDMRLVLLDPKRVELHQYSTLPHLWRPVATDDLSACKALIDVAAEMRKRYARFAKLKVRNIEEARAKGWKGPYIVVVIDELADLMQTAKECIEPAIADLGQLARAAGIHLLVATQRPSVNVITGKIKGNLPTRAAFKVPSHTDSRVILDSVGAETLTGNGDLLLKANDGSMTRAQGALVTDDEIERVVRWWTKS